MKKLNKTIFTTTNWLLTGLLTFLGFACSNDKEDGDDGGMVEYGTPYATYEIKGKVVDEQENPIPNIQISGEARIKVSQYKPIYPYPENEITTNQDGDFTATYGIFPTDTIQIISIDKNDNIYLNDTTKVGFDPEDFVGGKKWNRGFAKKEITIKLKSKNPK